MSAYDHTVPYEHREILVPQSDNIAAVLNEASEHGWEYVDRASCLKVPPKKAILDNSEPEKPTPMWLCMLRRPLEVVEGPAVVVPVETGTFEVGALKAPTEALEPTV